MSSILNDTKKILGLTEDYVYFDQDIILHINTVFSILSELGIGPRDGFRISDSSTDWNEYLEDNKMLEMVKTYIGLKVGMIFDPPVSSIVADAKNKMIAELEWRMNVSVDPKKNNPINGDLDNADPNEEWEDQEDLSSSDIDDLFS